MDVCEETGNPRETFNHLFLQRLENEVEQNPDNFVINGTPPFKYKTSDLINMLKSESYKDYVEKHGDLKGVPLTDEDLKELLPDEDEVFFDVKELEGE